MPSRCPNTGRLRRHFVWFIAQRFAEYHSAAIRCRTLTPASLSYSAFARAIDDAVGPVCIVYPTQKAAKAILILNTQGIYYCEVLDLRLIQGSAM